MRKSLKAKKLTEDFPNVFFVFDNENLYLKKIEKEIENHILQNLSNS